MMLREVVWVGKAFCFVAPGTVWMRGSVLSKVFNVIVLRIAFDALEGSKQCGGYLYGSYF